MPKHNDNLVKQRLLQLKKEATVYNSAHIANLGLTLLILNDKFDFDPDKLEQFIDAYKELLDCYNKGHLTFDDIVDTIKTETGIEICKKGGTQK